MKFSLFVIFFVAAFATLTTAQQRCPRCPQGVCPPSCTGDLNVGTNCTTAAPRRMWYFDQNSRICRPMAHLGCGGNNNRWCSKLACTLRCVLAIG